VITVNVDGQLHCLHCYGHASVITGMIDQHGNADVDNKGRLLLQLCCNNTDKILCIMNTFFQQRDVRK